MISALKNKKSGFASLTLLLFLPLLSLIIFSIAFMCYLIQYKTKMRSRCLTQSILIQKNLIRSEEELFKLNPLVLSLRTRLKLAYAELALAVTTENPALAAEAEIKIQQIKTQQKNLDQIQKALLHSAKTHLNIQIDQLQFELANLSHETQLNWDFYLESFSRVDATNRPEVAVVPDSPELAPVYELAQDYFERQKLAYVWHHRFHTKPSAQDILKSENSFEMSCGSASKKERTLWSVLISADKF